MILVAGGTGRLGTLVARTLAARGDPVRVLTRDPARADHLASFTEVVTGDVRRPATLAPAMAGVGLVVSAVHGMVGPRGISPETVDAAGNMSLVDAARDAGADVVLMSVVGASPDSALELFRAKAAAEQHLWATGIPATVVRSSAFMETWIDVVRESAGRSGRAKVFGRGDNPVNFVSVADVAASVVRAVVDRDLRGSTLEIGGPDNLTVTQFVEAVSAADARPLPPRPVPRAALRVMASTLGLLAPELGRQARAALAMDTTPLSMTSGEGRTRLDDVLKADLLSRGQR